MLYKHGQNEGYEQKLQNRFQIIPSTLNVYNENDKLSGGWI